MLSFAIATCVSAFKQGKMKLSSAEPTFVSTYSVLSLHACLLCTRGYKAN